MPPRKRTEGEELVHSLRNTFCALQFGVRALADTRTDESAFKAIHQAMDEKLLMMKGMISQAARLLSADRDRNGAAGPVRVLCVDASPDVAASMRMIIDAAPSMECVGCLASADHLVDEARRLTQPPLGPSLVVLLDAAIPGKGSLETVHELAAELPAIRTVLFTSGNDSGLMVRAIKAGARGCISKGEDPGTILRAIREAAGGSAW
jgi:CheY-like chemotaxis protein